ncbi:MAG: hypothetical protein HZB91_10405 [Elusimicrobia bacterium]|nr:hypothetical protein [Elusimicrobiota bacterium]
MTVAGPAIAWAVLALGLGYWNAALDRPGEAVMAVPAAEVSALCGRAGYPVEDLWKRLRALGVSAVLLPEERLVDLARDGRILSFSRAEWEKWGAMGLLAPGAKLRPGTVWIRDGAVMLRVAACARASGAVFSTSSAGGFFFIEFPESFDWPALPAGLAPDAAKALFGAGLMPVLEEGGGSVVVAGRRMKRVSASVDAPPWRILRAVHAGPHALVVWRLAQDRGVDGNVSALRDALKVLRRPNPGRPPSMPRPDASWEWPAKLVFGLIVLAGPILSARAALAALKGARPFVRKAAPLGSPVLEFAAALTACWGVALLAGLAARVAAHGAGESLGADLRAWALAGPLALGAASLFPPPWTALGRSWQAPLTPVSLLKVSLLAAAAYLCLNAGSDSTAAVIERVLDVLPGGAGASWWWAPERWREMLVGWPCLLAALVRVGRGWSRHLPEPAAEEPAADPRPWLLAGLLAPAGLVLAFCDLGVPLWTAAARSLAALALGAAFAAAMRVLGGGKSVVQ